MKVVDKELVLVVCLFVLFEGCKTISSSMNRVKYLDFTNKEQTIIAKNGSTILLNYTITGADELSEIMDMSSELKCYRTFPTVARNNAIDDEKEQISSYTSSINNFMSQNRQIKVVKRSDNGDPYFIYQIQFKPVHYGDAGKYTCEIYYREGWKENLLKGLTHILYVPKKPDETTLKITGDGISETVDKNGVRIYKLSTQTAVNIYCNSTGGLPEPDVEVFTKSEDSQEEKASKLFERIVSIKEIEHPTENPDIRFFNTMEYSTVLKRIGWSPSMEDDEKWLICRSDVGYSDYGTEIKEDRVLLHVTYEPSIECAVNLDYRGFQNTLREHTIICDIESNPVVRNEDISWTLPSGYSMFADQNENDTFTSAIIKKKEKLLTVSLKIFEKNSSDINQYGDYRLQANHEIQQKEHTISINKEQSSTTKEPQNYNQHDQNAASRRMTNLVSFLPLLLIILKCI